VDFLGLIKNILNQSIKENEDKTIPFDEDMQKVISEIMK